jgi:glycosyltransferase involved in cell wall biosynthesis
LAARHLLDSRPSADDVLVTFGQPMVDHLAGLVVKRRAGVRWIAHFSDPWADNPFDPKANTKRHLERSVVEAADRVILTSEETADLVMSKYPESFRRKVSVLPHSFDPRVYPDVQPSGPFIVVRYLGNLFAGRGPDALLQALTIMQNRSPAVLEKVRFEFIGDTAEAARNHALLSCLPSQCVRFLPKVSHADAMALMTSADLLLNIDAPANVSVFLPSKLVEYVGAERPIFGITPEGTAKRLIEDIGGWTADPMNISQIADNLAKALSNVTRFRGTKWGNEHVRRRYAASNVAAAFEDIVDVVVAG